MCVFFKFLFHVLICHILDSILVHLTLSAVAEKNHPFDAGLLD